MSNFDVVFIIVILGAAIGLNGISKLLSFYCIFVAGHFFLFCNVIRMSRIPELIWASTFSVFAISHHKTGVPSLVITILISLLCTFILVVIELRKPSYHGVFWQRLNPHLPNWFNARNMN